MDPWQNVVYFSVIFLQDKLYCVCLRAFFIKLRITVRNQNKTEHLRITTCLDTKSKYDVKIVTQFPCLLGHPGHKT